MKKLIFPVFLLLVLLMSFLVVSQSKQSTGQFTVGNEPPFVVANTFAVQDGPGPDWDNTLTIDTHDADTNIRVNVKDANPDDLNVTICIGTAANPYSSAGCNAVKYEFPVVTAASHAGAQGAQLTYIYNTDPVDEPLDGINLDGAQELITLTQADCGPVSCSKTFYVDIIVDDQTGDPAVIDSFQFDLINQVPTIPSTLDVTSAVDPVSYAAAETHSQTPDLSWTATDLDDGLSVDRWPADILIYHIQVGELAAGDEDYLIDPAGASASATVSNPIPWGPEDPADPTQSKKTVQVRIWTEDQFGVVSSNFNTTFDLIDKLPSLVNVYASSSTINELTDSCIDFLPVNCFINPAQGDYGSVNIQVKVDDPDGDDCSLGTHKANAVLCLVDAAGAELCDTVNNANYSYTLSFQGQSATQCDFGISIPSGNSTGIEFFQLPGIYKLYVNSSSQSEVTSSAWVYNYEWEYGENYAVDYPASVSLGDGAINLGAWNPGTTLYTMINQGNILLNLQWQATDPKLPTYTCTGTAPDCCVATDPAGCWDLTTSNDLQIDDDIDQVDDTGNLPAVNIPEEQITPSLIQFQPEPTGLEICDVMTCDNPALEETLDTGFHIKPPLGLPTGTYETTIKIDLAKRI